MVRDEATWARWRLGFGDELLSYTRDWEVVGRPRGRAERR